MRHPFFVGFDAGRCRRLFRRRLNPTTTAQLGVGRWILLMNLAERLIAVCRSSHAMCPREREAAHGNPVLRLCLSARVFGRPGCRRRAVAACRRRSCGESTEPRSSPARRRRCAREGLADHLRFEMLDRLAEGAGFLGHNAIPLFHVEHHAVSVVAEFRTSPGQSCFSSRAPNAVRQPWWPPGSGPRLPPTPVRRGDLALFGWRCAPRAQQAAASRRRQWTGLELGSWPRSHERQSAQGPFWLCRFLTTSSAVFRNSLV
jgi:hypothetical protein